MTGYPPRLMLSACFQKSPVGVPAPGALWFLSGVSLIRVTSLKDLRLLEDDFDKGRPATGYPPRLMLSASLPERLWGYPLPARFGSCRVSLWWERLR